MPVVPPPVWDNVPPELAARQAWLLWKFEAKPGAVKPGKIPYYVAGGRRTGGQGDERDLARLATLDVVRRAYERGGWSGIGYAFLPGDGLIGIDIDGAIDPETGEVSARCQAIIDACASYTEYSPSGKGVHIIVQGTTTTNKSNDIGLEMFCGRQFFTFTARIWPGSPVSVATIDDAVIKRLHATIDEAKGKRKAQAPSVSSPAPTSAAQPDTGGESPAQLRARVESALQAVSPDLGYSDWIAIGWALRDAFGDFGFGLWDAWSSRSAKYQGDSDLQSHWKSFTSSKAPGDAVAVIFARAKEAGWKPMRLARSPKPAPKPPRANDGPPGGEPPSAPGMPPDGGDGGDGDDLSELWNVLITKGENRTPVDCRENVLYCLRHDPALAGLVRHNQFTELHERSRVTPWGHGPGEWDDEDDLMLGEYLARRVRLLIKATTNLRAGVLMAAREHKFNPVVDLIRSEPWDGTRRLPHWLADCLGVEQTEYSALIGECFIKGMVNRALRPGCKFDYMLIFKGPQGAKKSTVFRELAAPWFTDNAIRMGDKDSLMALQSIWIAESSELESMNKTESKAIKQFLSANEDMYRPPYGARMLKRPRHSVFGGTTNDDTFLRDATGDRRFWPITVGEINIEGLQAMRLQLFAEALAMIESDDAEQRRTYPTPAQERELIFPQQEHFKMTDVWEDVLYDYVNANVNHKTDHPDWAVPRKRQFFSTRELFAHAICVPMDRIDGNKLMETRIANAMRAIGFDKHRESGGDRKRGYMRRPPPDVAPAVKNAPGPSGEPESTEFEREEDALPL